MPRLKKDTVNVKISPNNAPQRRESVEVEFHVNSAGEFYCEVPERLLVAVPGIGPLSDSKGRVFVRENRASRKSLYAQALDDLYVAIRTLLAKACEPKVTTETLILYNIESHVSFAVGEDGDIARNATGNAKWVSVDERYGNHHATNCAQGGYSLVVGAKVVTRMTVDYGNSKDVEDITFKPEQEIDENGNQHPASKLNSWCSFSLPKGCKSMPYSDEAALFFDNMMMGMARLSRMIQEQTYEPEDLTALIQSQQTLLPSPD